QAARARSSATSSASGCWASRRTEPAMRIGILSPTRGVVMQSARRPPVDECWAMARLADEAGYDAVWVGDSIVAKPRLEPLTTLAYLAGITTRVRLGTAVLLPALRHPVELTDHTIGPLPWHPAGPPVLITAANRGEMLAAQFDRFGRLGDGIITTYVHAEECRLVRERAEEALARHDRTGVGFTLCVYTT